MEPIRQLRLFPTFPEMKAFNFNFLSLAYLDHVFKTSKLSIKIEKFSLYEFGCWIPHCFRVHGETNKHATAPLSCTFKSEGTHGDTMQSLTK
jgi:hypothetical protein